MIGDRTKDEQTVRDFRETFESPAGKRVLENLNKYSGALTVTPPTDALKMAYKEGQRSVIIHIYSKLNRKINEPKET